MSGQIEIEGLKDVEKSLTDIGKNVSENGIQSILKIGYKIKVLAQTRIKDKEHIVTSRLRNSIFVQAKDKSLATSLPENDENYSWTEGQKKYGKQISKGKAGRGKRTLESVVLTNDEIAVGTNVDYGSKIERMDSFLYWAAKNININIEQYFLGVEKAKRIKNNTL